jgi:hypothetical protein
MKIGVVTDISQSLPSLEEDFDLFIIAGNFMPLYDSGLVTWNIVNQVDFIENKLNPWIKNIKSKYKLVMGGPNDHLAQFYGSQTSFYIHADYVQDELITYSGINLYGMPWVPRHYFTEKRINGAFKSRDNSFFKIAIDSIHDNTDILITNVPPKLNFNGENHFEDGDIYLSNKINALKNIKYHIFSLPTGVDYEFEKTIKHRSLCCDVVALKNKNFLYLEV